MPKTKPAWRRPPGRRPDWLHYCRYDCMVAGNFDRRGCHCQICLGRLHGVWRGIAATASYTNSKEDEHEDDMD